MSGRPVRTTALALRALGALALLAGALLGVPVALARLIGWPLPHGIPSWAEVGRALGGASVTDDAVLKTLAAATWVVWALILACFVSEVAAWMRGREAARIPVAGLVQPVVRQLVMSATLLFGILRPSALTLYAFQPATPVVATFVASAPAEATPPPVASRAEARRPSCVVAPRDSLWKLAERHLGDGMRWREIWDLNRDSVLGDGHRFDNPNLILPGWVLTMPADATGLSQAPEPAPPVQPPPAPAMPTAPSSVASPPAAPTTTPSPARRSAPGVALAPNETRVDRNDPDYDVAPRLAASALVAAGVIAAVTKLRRRQQRHREAGRMIRLPSKQAARTETHLRRAAVDAPFDRLDLALRAFANCLGRRRPGPSPAISVLSVGPEAIELVLSEPADAPSGPFEVTAGGKAWTLPAGVADDELRPLAETQSAPAPGLVTVGTVDERTVMIDLEAGARTIVGGDPDDALALLWCMATELATSNRADDLDLVLVGKPPGGLDALDRVRVVDSVDEVVATIEAEVAVTTASLVKLRRSSTIDARSCDPTLLLTPTAVLVADQPAGPALQRLLEIARDSHGLAVVVAGQDVDAVFDRELCVEADTMVVKPLGLHLRPAALPMDVVTDVGELLAAAVDLRPGPAIDLDLAPACHPPSEGLTIGPDNLALTFDAAGNPVVPAGHVLVRLLGPVEIVGSDRPIDRRRCVELIAYLALHPEGVDEGRIKAALWPEARPTRGAFNETVSRARRLLGLDPMGVHHLLPVDNRRYRLGPYVATDSDVLQRSTGCTDAVRLVRGLPFEGTGPGYEWAYEESHAYRLGAMLEELRDRGLELTGQLQADDGRVRRAHQ